MREGAAVEHVILENLREKYVGDGYAFFAYPGRELVPAFLQDYRPDAIAIGPRGQVVIEVENQRGPKGNQLSRIASLFSDHPDWKFLVVYSDEQKSAGGFAAAPSRRQIERALEEIEALSAAGHARAAFVLGWATLEASYRALNQDRSEAGDRPRPPRQILEGLEREGHLDREFAQPLWEAVDLRNAVVHGDLQAEVDAEDVARLVRAIRQVLGEFPA